MTESKQNRCSDLLLYTGYMTIQLKYDVTHDFLHHVEKFHKEMIWFDYSSALRHSFAESALGIDFS